MGLGDWWKKILRERDQETIELAEEGVAPESEVRQTEEWMAEKHHRDETDAAAD